MRNLINKSQLYLILVLSASFNVHAEDVFDNEILKRLGYTESSVDYLSKGENFAPGNNEINFIINNLDKGFLFVNVRKNGEICWTKDILKHLDIDESALLVGDDNCGKMPSEIKVAYNINRNNINILVPVKMMLAKRDYVSGGQAIIFNYDGTTREYNSNGEKFSSKSLTSELGGNYKNWVFRSSQSYYSYRNNTNITRLSNYLQRSFVNSKNLLRLGQFTTGGSAYSGVNITGVEISPESGLSSTGVVVNLKVYSPSAAQVNIYQKGVLLKTVNVDAGTTTIEDVPILNQSDDFILSLIGNSGESTRQIIPFIQADSFSTFSKESGITAYAGKLRMTKQDLPVAAVSSNIYNNSLLSVYTGGLLSSKYQSIILGGGVRFDDKSLFRISTTNSHSQRDSDSDEKKGGLRNDISLSYKLTSKVSVITSANFRTNGYMDLSSAGNSWYTAEDAGNTKEQYSLGLTYQNEQFGSISLNGSSSRQYNNTTVNSYAINWGRGFEKININLGLQNNRLTNKKTNYNDKYAYINISIPLGENKNVQLYTNHSDGMSRYGTAYSQTVNDKLNYDLSTESSSGKDNNFNAVGYYNSKYSRLALGASTGNGTKSYRAGMKGGVVLHDNGVTFTPRQVSDTFGIVTVKSKESDIEIITPAGKVWTDGQGQAIASSSAWRKNRIQVNVGSLKKNLEVQSGIAELTPSRGSVTNIALPVYRVKRVLLNFIGLISPLSGAAVLDSKGRNIAFVGEDKTIFIDNFADDVITTTDSSGGLCRIKFPDKYELETDTIYTPLTVRCLSDKQ